MKTAILAALALVSASYASSQQIDASEKMQAEASQAQKQIADRLGSIDATLRQSEHREDGSKEKEPCQPGEQNRHSELCAQWNAVDSADNAAYYGKVGAWISAISLIGVLGALVISVHANILAGRTARHQLRAYVDVGSANLRRLAAEEDGGTIRDSGLHLRITNFGATPATDVSVLLEFGFFNEDQVIYWGANHSTHEIGRLSPGQTALLTEPFSIDKPFAHQISTNWHKCFLTVTLVYKDAFDPKGYSHPIHMVSTGLDTDFVIRAETREQKN